MTKVVLADGLRRVSVMHELHVVDPSAMTVHTRHRYDLRCTGATRFFQRRYTWTGTGIESVPEVEPNEDSAGHRRHRLHGPVVREGNHRNLMVVDLGRTLDVGDSTSVHIRHRFIDTSGDFVRYMGHLAAKGLKEIHIRVILPPALSGSVRAMQQPEGADHATDLPGLECSVVNIGNARYDLFEVHVYKPERSVHYFIEFPQSGLEPGGSSAQ